MSGTAGNNPEHRRIDSWKEIAAFFGRDERTVKRWEKERGLPVHRVPGERGGVFAYADELSRWLHSSKAIAPEAEDLPAAERAPERARGPELVTAARVETAAAHRSKAGKWVGLGLAVAAAAFAIWAFSVEHRHVTAMRAAMARRADPHAPDPVAREFYLKGRYEWNRRTEGSLSLAVDAFTQAVVHDSGYAEAYAGLAECYDVMPEFTSMPQSEAFPRAIAAAQKAIALNDSLGEAHRALAFGLFYWEWKVPQALSEYRRSIDLDPRDEEAHHWYATSLFELGQWPEAQAEIDRAQQLKPESRSILADQAIIRYRSGDRERPRATLRAMEEAEPDFASAPRYLADIDWIVGADRDWIEQSRRLGTLAKDQAQIDEADAAEKGLKQGGERGMLEALRGFERQQMESGHGLGFALAKTETRLNEKPEAVDALRAAMAAHDFRVVGIGSDPDFAALHGDPGFEALLREVSQRIAWNPGADGTHR